MFDKDNSFSVVDHFSPKNNMKPVRPSQSHFLANLKVYSKCELVYAVAHMKIATE